ncbi:hypothetical protein ACFY0A_24950 [Streptomyces sp. NPDC001698]|uniref:hypothetical protein n=1 Tax=Streptomyces sp. NPDC001698 TaxID=3364601 RepID=UPI0036C3F569
MYPENAPHAPAVRAVEVHHPTPIPPAAVPIAAPLVPVQPGQVPAVASVVLPDGRVVTGYSIEPAKPDPVAAKPAVSRAAVNVALAGVVFLAICGGLLLIILAAVIFGGWIAVQVFTAGGHKGGTTVNIRRAVIKRNHFHG